MCARVPPGSPRRSKWSPPLRRWLTPYSPPERRASASAATYRYWTSTPITSPVFWTKGTPGKSAKPHPSPPSYLGLLVLLASRLSRGRSHWRDLLRWAVESLRWIWLISALCHLHQNHPARWDSMRSFFFLSRHSFFLSKRCGRMGLFVERRRCLQPKSLAKLKNISTSLSWKKKPAVSQEIFKPAFREFEPHRVQRGRCSSVPGLYMPPPYITFLVYFLGKILRKLLAAMPPRRDDTNFRWFFVALSPRA